MSDEKLSALETEVAEVISILLALDPESDATDSQSITKDCIDQYVQQVERIGDAASEAGFPGLQDACLLLQENLISLDPFENPISQEERDLLEEWPTLVMGYLASYDDASAADEIIRHLQTPCWSNPLPEEFSDVLKSLLISPNSSSSDIHSNEDSTADNVSINEFSPEDSAEQPLFEVPRDNELTDDDAQQNNAEQPLFEITGNDELTKNNVEDSDVKEDELTDNDIEDSDSEETEKADLYPTIADLTATGDLTLEEEFIELVSISEQFLTAGTDTEKLKQSIGLYDQQIARIGAIAGTNGFIGLQELSMLLQENLRYIDFDSNRINEEELNLLEVWPGLALVYLENPSDLEAINGLIEHLQNPAWSRSLPDIYTDTLQSLLSPANEEAPASSAESTEHQAITNDSTNAIENSITEEGAMDFVPSWDELLATPKEKSIDLQLESYTQQQDGMEISVLNEDPFKEHDSEFSDQEENIANDDKHEPDYESKSNEVSRIQIETEIEAEAEDEQHSSKEKIETATLVSPIATPEAKEPLKPAEINDQIIATQDPDTKISDIQEQAESLSEAEGISIINQDFVELLQQEMIELTESSEKILEPVLSDNDDITIRQHAFNSYNEELSKLVEVSQAVGLLGLHHVGYYIKENQTQFAELNRLLSAEEKDLLLAWPRLALQYLQAPNDRAISQSVAEYLQTPHWLMPMGEQEADNLSKLLNDVEISAELPDDLEERQRHAQSADVSLELPEEVNPELLDSLLQELPSQTADFSSVIQKFIENQGTLVDVDHAQRLAHTLKGAANTVGVAGIANITHHTEDILVALTRYHSLPSPSLSETLMNVADCLETMSEALVGMSSPPEDAINILQSVLDWANKIDKEGISNIDSEAPEIVATTPEPVVIEAANTDIESEVAAADTAPVPVSSNNTPAKKAEKESEPQPAGPMLRVPAPLIDDLLRLVGESIILTGQVQERINTNIAQAQAVKEQNILLQQLTAELEQLVDVQGIATTLEQQSSWHDSDFDPLEFDQYNELHTVTRRLVEIANDARALDEHISDNFTALETLLIDQGHLHRESQEAVLRTRMIPVKTVVPRLQRSVRQTCRLTDKQVDLDVKGVDTLMDTNILSDMLDPLMHVLRNAVDHGIEAPDVRAASNKPITGKINLSFTREGNSIVVRCEDDGAGLNYDSIREVAEQKQLIMPDQSVSEEELNRLILQPGFSTRTHATQVSGRGIGMDAVYNQLLEIKGSINISSITGKGCLVELRLPVTLISTHALLIRVRKQIFAVSDRGVEQILHANSGELSRVGDIVTYQIGDDVYEVVYLDALLKLPADRRKNERINRPALLVRDETGTVRAVMIEEIFESRDLVVKSMGEYVPKLPGILGATILGDGSVTPVLDIPELLRTPVKSLLPSYQPQFSPDSQELQQHLVLIVDDSLSVRRSMQQLVGDAGFEVRTARDGLEAIELLNTIQPDLLLVDLEMPRMNGLELTTHIRAQLKTQQIPIIMITSRSTQKHRQEAESAGVNAYITKPVADDLLLAQINKALH